MGDFPRCRRRLAPAVAALALGAGCATRTASTRTDDPRLAAAAPAPPLRLGGDEAGDPQVRPTQMEPARADAGADLPPAASTPPSIPEATPARPIDLTTALRLADGQNPVIGEARALILGALGQRAIARTLLFPSLNAGFNYRDHNGVFQRSSGQILGVTEQSFYYGGGAAAIGSGTVTIPAVNVFTPLTDALYEPLAAEQRVVGARLNASATANTTLLEVAGLFVDLVGAEAILAARMELAADFDRIVAGVQAYAATGQGRRSDAERAEADRRRFQALILAAQEDVAVASAQLAQRLTLDPSARLQPIFGPLQPITLIDPDTPAEDLIRSAVVRRPDLAARDALAMQAQYLVREEKARPFLPTIWVGFSAGSFGGGSNFTPPALGRYDGRTDFDVQAYWTLVNFGVGNASRIKQRRAQFGQAQAERVRVLNQVRGEVTSARADALAARTRVDIARIAVRTSEDGYRQDQIRLRESLGKPIESLDSLRLLVDARIGLIRAITAANRAQLALFVSLGAPPPLPDGPAPTQAGLSR